MVNDINRFYGALPPTVRHRAKAACQQHNKRVVASVRVPVVRQRIFKTPFLNIHNYQARPFKRLESASHQITISAIFLPA